MTDSSGTIKERYAYTAYGVPSIFDGTGTVLTSSAENNRYTYTGREWDDVAELYYYRARVYEPITGRFMSRDPIGFDGYPPHRYLYVANRPTKYMDPEGLSFRTQGFLNQTRIACRCAIECNGWLIDLTAGLAARSQSEGWRIADEHYDQSDE